MVEELHGVPDQEQAGSIAQYYAQVTNEYKALEKTDIPTILYQTEDLPPIVEPY